MREHGLALSTSQRKQLKQLAHHLASVVQIGRAGASAQFVQSLDLALTAHELVKVKFVAHKEEKTAICAQLAAQSRSELVTVIGHVAVFFRQNVDESQRTVEFQEPD